MTFIRAKACPSTTTHPQNSSWQSLPCWWQKNYRRFATAAEAIRYASRTCERPKPSARWLQVGDAHFNSAENYLSYEAKAYPLLKLE